MIVKAEKTHSSHLQAGDFRAPVIGSSLKKGQNEVSWCVMHNLRLKG